MLASRFFRVYTQWRWPNPVLLCSMDEGSLGLQVWDPRRNPKDRLHMMPIITPAYPCMNSSYNVSASTLRIMTGEFQRGKDICEVKIKIVRIVLASMQIVGVYDSPLMSCRLWKQTKLTGIPSLSHLHSLKRIKTIFRSTSLPQMLMI